MSKEIVAVVGGTGKEGSGLVMRLARAGWTECELRVLRGPVRRLLRRHQRDPEPGRGTDEAVTQFLATMPCLGLS